MEKERPLKQSNSRNCLAINITIRCERLITSWTPSGIVGIELFADCVSRPPLRLGLARHLLKTARRSRTTVLNNLVFENLQGLDRRMSHYDWTRDGGQVSLEEFTRETLLHQVSSWGVEPIGKDVLRNLTWFSCRKGR